jgi:hypothetical protein
MALIVEKENPPAGTNYKVGDNAELDAAIQAGEAPGITVGADGYYIKEDGGRIESAGGTIKVVDLSSATAEDMANIAKLAEAHFLAQTTGVSGSVLNAAKEAVGIDPNDYSQDALYYKLLDESGYDSGDPSKTFNKNGYTGTDPAVNILRDRLDQRPTDEELEAAGLDPSEYTVVNNNAANAFYLEQELTKQGLGYSSTNAVRASTRGYLGRDNDTMQQVRDSQDALMLKTKGEGNFRTSDKELDMLEWDLIKKKKTGVDTTGGTTATVTGANFTGQGQGQITGGATGTITPPSYSSTPTIGVVTPTYGAGQTGTSETTIPTYEDGLKKQATQFQNRATCQATFYQPQTLAEQEAAGTVSAFENVLYRNRFGMSMYVQHINGVPSQPIPPGYFKVQQFTTQDQTQGAAAGAQGKNQGGMIQGLMGGGVVSPFTDDDRKKFRIFYPNGTYSSTSYNTEAQAQAAIDQQNAAAGWNGSGGSGSGSNPYADATVNPALNYTPGGRVTAQSDGTFVLTYPDGTTSQAYSTSEEAQQADNLGKASKGILTFDEYSQSQGYNPDLPGYDQISVENLYNTYVTDTYSSQEAADAAAKAPPPEADVNTDFVSGETQVSKEDLGQYQANLNAQVYANPAGAVAAAPVSYIDPNTPGSVIESTAGRAQDTAPMVESDQVAQISAATTADTPQKIGASQVDPNYVFSDVQNATAGMTAAQSTGPTQTIDAAQQTDTSLSGLTSATGDSVDVTGAPTRTLETIDGQSELITGTGVDQSKVLSAFGEGEIKAASVQDELTGLMRQFEGGETPAWAAGSMRSAMATLAARGLGASSMAGQAVIQAAMESALPIAQIDAGNKQQMALFKGEQRAKFLQMDFDQAFQAKVMNAAKVSEIANMNFTAEQQIALENSRAANTMQLQNLNNSQALIMAEAAALSQMDTQNLNNRQQANVQNAQNFLQIDMANLSNEQQTALFKQQSLVNSLLTDQAAANAALQFNASSENQTNQFFANLSSSVNQFNSAQMNAMKQFNADEVNSLLEFNAGMQNQREMFNAQNYLVVAQANAQWRQNLSTINTATANESNMAYTQAVNGLTMTSLDEIWQRERDILSMAFQISENNANRANEIVLQKLSADAGTDAAKLQAEIEASSGAGDFVKEVFLKIIGI